MMKRGFTLVEILLSIVLFGLAVVPLLAGFARSTLSSIQNERETRVVFLAEQLIEHIKGQAINNFTGDYTQPATAFPDPDSMFKFTVDYYTSTGDDGNLLKSIHVTVWYDSDGDDTVDTEEEQIELFTKVAKRA